MFRVKARCTCGPEDSFRPTTIERRSPGPHDVVIDIAYAGICHSDIEHARSVRGTTLYPLVPGHEVCGLVEAVGTAVTRFSVGDRVGVGNLVDSCRQCESCRSGLEQYCSKRVLAYNAVGYDGRRTYGGYSQKTVVDEAFVVRVPDRIALKHAAPLMCAGITMYSPMRHWKVGPGTRLGIIGLGGLGHIGIQMARALGAHTTVFERSADKQADALRLGASAFRLTQDPATFNSLASSLDIIISTVAIEELDPYLGLLAIDGVLVNLSIPSRPLSAQAAALLANRRSIAGTRSGGIAETQEMLDFCQAHAIAAEVETIGADEIDGAYTRLLAGDVRFRFVIDTKTMGND
jgi:uncharacterized zinc-type alcohol dehydrogenase-like protein